MCLPFSRLNGGWNATEIRLSRHHSVAIKPTYSHHSVDWKVRFHPVIIWMSTFTSSVLVSVIYFHMWARTVIQRGKKYFCIMSKNKNLGHFHAIVSIAGFFSRSYFCINCRKPYEKKTSHSCVTHCNVCLSDNCPKSSPGICPNCNRTCRSPSCLQRHETRTDKGVLPCELK